MPSKNIFGGQSTRALFAHYVYEELRKREFVTLVDVLCKAITDHLVSRFSYQRFGQEPFELTFHPQLLKEYIPAPRGFYQQFFKDIIGVTHEPNTKVELVVIRTKTEYQHGLMLTKKLHESQIETLPFGEHDGQCYGEIQLTIEPNRELLGKILAYGQYLEVVAPQSLRERIRDIVNQQLGQYNE